MENPPESSDLLSVFVNGRPMSVPPATTISSLLTQMGKPTKNCAVEVNEELVPRASHTTRVLCEGDRLEIVTLVGGG